jgi:hypothetical protein
MRARSVVYRSRWVRGAVCIMLSGAEGGAALALGYLMLSLQDSGVNFPSPTLNLAISQLAI